MLMSMFSCSYRVWMDLLLLLTLLYFLITEWMQYSLDCILIIHVKGLDLISDLIIFKTLKQQSFNKNQLTKLLPDAKVHWYLLHHVVHMPTPDTILSQLYSPNLLVHTIMISQPWAKLVSNNENHEEEALTFFFSLWVIRFHKSNLVWIE